MRCRSRATPSSVMASGMSRSLLRAYGGVHGVTPVESRCNVYPPDARTARRITVSRVITAQTLTSVKRKNTKPKFKYSIRTSCIEGEQERETPTEADLRSNSVAPAAPVCVPSKAARSDAYEDVGGDTTYSGASIRGTVMRSGNRNLGCHRSSGEPLCGAK